MSDLRNAKARMNLKVTAALMSRPISDPSDLDCLDGPPPAFMCVDDALALDDGRETIVCGSVVSAMPWEVIL